MSNSQSVCVNYSAYFYNSLIEYLQNLIDYIIKYTKIFTNNFVGYLVKLIACIHASNNGIAAANSIVSLLAVCFSIHSTYLLCTIGVCFFVAGFNVNKIIAQTALPKFVKSVFGIFRRNNDNAGFFSTPGAIEIIDKTNWENVFPNYDTADNLKYVYVVDRVNKEATLYCRDSGLKRVVTWVENINDDDLLNHLNRLSGIELSWRKKMALSILVCMVAVFVGLTSAFLVYNNYFSLFTNLIRLLPTLLPLLPMSTVFASCFGVVTFVCVLAMFSDTMLAYLRNPDSWALFRTKFSHIFNFMSSSCEYLDYSKFTINDLKQKLTKSGKTDVTALVFSGNVAFVKCQDGLLYVDRLRNIVVGEPNNLSNFKAQLAANKNSTKTHLGVHVASASLAIGMAAAVLGYISCIYAIPVFFPVLLPVVSLSASFCALAVFVSASKMSVALLTQQWSSDNGYDDIDTVQCGSLSFADYDRLCSVFTKQQVDPELLKQFNYYSSGEIILARINNILYSLLCLPCLLLGASMTVHASFNSIKLSANLLWVAGGFAFVFRSLFHVQNFFDVLYLSYARQLSKCCVDFSMVCAGLLSMVNAFGNGGISAKGGLSSNELMNFMHNLFDSEVMARTAAGIISGFGGLLNSGATAVVYLHKKAAAQVQAQAKSIFKS